MYIDYRSWDAYEYKITALYLDMSNPRIRHLGKELNQAQIMQLLIDQEKVYDLAKKIAEEGYFVGEEPIICFENGRKVVLEGNRRMASLKLLQNPEKYLPINKAKILKNLLQKNNEDFSNSKIRCYIAPNRLHANAIIYERHKGDAVHKWKTGNQYAFISEMYERDGLSIDDICDILNQRKSLVIKPLKTYNLFNEGKPILAKKEGILIDIANFELTNLERLIGSDDVRSFLGIDFDLNTGELIINLPVDEFENRMVLVFKELIDASNFSRRYNTKDDLSVLIESLKASEKVDMSVVVSDKKSESRTALNRKKLEEEKEKNIQSRKRRKGNFRSKCIIPNDKEIIFGDEKIDTLFEELKGLQKDKVYSFSLLLRTYLEQSLYHYFDVKGLKSELSKQNSETKMRNNEKKVSSLCDYLKNQYDIKEDIDKNNIMNILRFNDKKEFDDSSLKGMFDYIFKHELCSVYDSATLKNIKDYAERIKMGLDLAVHNKKTIIDVNHNSRAWHHLEPLFDYLSKNIKNEF